MQNRLRRTLACALLAGVAAMATSASARAQETINQASVSGRVTDAQGGVIPGAAVTARHIDTNVSAQTTTDADGRFRFPYLRLGAYDITVSLSGFTPRGQTLTLRVGSAFDLSIVLEVAGLSEDVRVVAEAPIIETARSQVAGTVDEAEVRALPLNGRNFLDIALLVPGVSPTNTNSTQLFAETSAVPGQGVSVGSQRNLSNSFIVDGLSANDDAAGVSGMPYTVDAVEQFQVVTAGGQAELGRALGGYINVVTKSGSNATRGDVYSYWRDDRLNAANALTGTRLPMSQQQGGMSLGGPVRTDRSFYFLNVEGRRLNQTGVTTIAPVAADAINARLQAVGYPGPLVTTGPYANPVRSLNLVGKVDHVMRAGRQLTLKYSLYHVTAENSRGAGGLSAPSASSGLDNLDHGLAFSHTVSMGTHTVNETRAQVVDSTLEALSSDRVGPAVSIAGVASFGTLSGSPQRRQNRLFQIVNSVSQQRGTHALRAGADLLSNDDTINYPRSYRGAYTFSSLTNFLAGVYNTSGFTQTFGVADVHQTNPNLGVYAQDAWTPRASLTVNLGLRYDVQVLPSIRTDRNNVSPRAGLAWAPGARRTVVRASAGVFYDRVPLRAVANALLSAKNTTDLTQLQQTSVSLSPTQAGAPVFPAILAAPVPSVTLVNLTTMDPGLRNASSRQASVEVERQLGTTGTVSVGYDYLQGRHLLMSINQNVPTCLPAGTNNGCRPVSAYANNSRYSSAGHSVYHGVHVSLVQRPATWGHYRVSYTRSSSKNNVGEFFFSSPIDPFDLSKDWGRSDDDQRHRLVIHGVVQVPSGRAPAGWRRVIGGTQLSAAVQAYSALPFNITSGVTTLQGTPGRPIVDGVFIPRNAGTGSASVTVNARVSRVVTLSSRVRADVAVEAFNLLNRANVVTRNGNFGAGAYPTAPSATFGQATGVAESRALQLAVRTRF